MREQILKQIAEAREKNETLLSFSRLETANDCLYCYNEIYNNKHRGLDNIYGILGGLVHEGLELYYNTGENKLSEIFENGYKKAKKDGYDFSNDVIKENYLYCVRHYIKNFKGEDLKGLQEFPFMIELNGSKIIGYIDRITKDPNSNENTFRIIDFKTSTMYSKEDKKKKGRQLVLYAYAVEQITGKKVTSICWNMLKYVKITYKGKTRKRSKFFLRNGYVLAWKNEIMEELEKIGVEFEDAIDIFTEALTKNEIPEQIKDAFIFEDALVEHEYNEETIQDVLDYIEDTIKTINKTSKWKTKTITESNNFKCLYLCNFRDCCPSVKSYLNKIPEHMIEEDDDFESLF